MKKINLLLLSFLIVTAVYSQGPGYANLHIPDPFIPEFAPEVVLVKFRDDVSIQVRKTKSTLQTGISSVDAFLRNRK